MNDKTYTIDLNKVNPNNVMHKTNTHKDMFQEINDVCLCLLYLQHL